MFDADSHVSMTFTAMITRDEDGWYIAECEELPGVVTQGRTLSQVRSRFSEALEGHLEALAELRAKRGKPSKHRIRHTGLNAAPSQGDGSGDREGADSLWLERPPPTGKSCPLGEGRCAACGNGAGS